MEKIDNLGGGSEVRTTDEHGGERSGGVPEGLVRAAKVSTALDPTDAGVGPKNPKRRYGRPSGVKYLAKGETFGHVLM